MFSDVTTSGRHFVIHSAVLFYHLNYKHDSFLQRELEAERRVCQEQALGRMHLMKLKLILTNRHLRGFFGRPNC